MLELSAAEPLRTDCGALLFEQFLRSRMELFRLAPLSLSTPGDCYRSSQPETVTMRTKRRRLTKLTSMMVIVGVCWSVEMRLTEAHVRDEDRAVIGYKLFFCFKLSPFCRDVPARPPRSCGVLNRELREACPETTVGHGQRATTTSMLVHQPPRTSQETKRTTHKHQNTEFGTKHVAHHINGTGMYKPDSKIRAQKSAVTSHMLRRLCTHPPRNQCCS